MESDKVLAVTSKESQSKTSIERDDERTKYILNEILQNLKADSSSWSWDRKAAKSTCPNEVVFSQENSTVIFHPSYSFGTAAVFGERPLDTRLVSYWEVEVPRFYGTSMMLGLGTRQSNTLSPTRFEHLLGSRYSCGLAHNGYLYRGDNKLDLPAHFCPPFTQDKRLVVGMMFHGPQKWLAYFLDGQPLGVAFRGLDMDGQQLFPMVSSTAQKSQFSLGKQWISSKWPLYSLSSTCLKKVSECIAEDTSKIAKLNIPEVLAKALYRDICFRQDYHLRNRKKKKPTKKTGSAPGTAQKRRRMVVQSTIIQQFDDELEMGRLSRLVVSSQLQSVLNGSSGHGEADRQSVDQRVLKRTRV